ncbi:permease [Geomonas azotofigens]|uniref:permease n=1 Tax=Geomonas azotofigens TaxID=2843196 RepID=UPI002E2AC731|nr:permease [Geomonas azotofigens]
MKLKLVDYRLFVIVLAANLALYLWQPATARLAALNSTGFLMEVLSIVPPVMVLMGLMDVWVPRRLVESHLGPDSGAIGAGVAMLLGTAAAGPLYAAFPVAVSLRRKGARLANIVIFLGTWGTIKIPMILMESSFISLRFALLRLALTVPCILVCGYLMERLLPEQELGEEPTPADA